jgi:manganese/zinc/iron transport system substrate-binding protein
MYRIIGFGLIFVVVGCVGRTSQEASSFEKSDRSGKIQVIATVGMVADLVQRIGQTNVEVTQIMGAGVDPHLYKATRDDVQSIMQGDLVFYSGLMLEGKMIDTLVKLGRGKKVIAVTEALDESSLLEPEEFQGHFDPHVWMDASAWAKCCNVIANGLSEHDPEHTKQYHEAAEALEAEILKMHQYGKDCIATIPEGSRVLITSHDAFNYFGRAYGLEVMGIQGISTESEAGLQRINEFVDLLVDRKVQAVFVESSVPRKNIDSLIEGAKSRGHEVKVGGELFSDAMGLGGTYEGTYLGMLDHNITTVTRALGGKAPERGMSGKLGMKDRGQ